jgi:hypothetical protein
MDDINQLQQLLQELMQAADEVLSSGEEIPDEFMDELSNEIEATQSRIQALGTPAKQPMPEMEHAMPSSNINSFSYDPKKEELYVKFQGDYPFQNGSMYKYGGIPPYVADAFKQGAASAKTEGENDWGQWWEGKNPSMGAALNQLIKGGGFPYSRIS